MRASSRAKVWKGKTNVTSVLDEEETMPIPSNNEFKGEKKKRRVPELRLLIYLATGNEFLQPRHKDLKIGVWKRNSDKFCNELSWYDLEVFPDNKLDLKQVMEWTCGGIKVPGCTIYRSWPVPKREPRAQERKNSSGHGLNYSSQENWRSNGRHLNSSSSLYDQKL